QAVVCLLHGWWTPTPTCRRWLDNPFYRSYAVLTMCRMHYTLQYGVVVSKPLAARWAEATLDARWRPLIQAALAWSSDIVPDLRSSCVSCMAGGRRRLRVAGGSTIRSTGRTPSSPCAACITHCNTA